MIGHNILIASKDFVNHEGDYYKLITDCIEVSEDNFDQIIQVEEDIDTSGNIIESLEEHEINRVLRLVYKEKHANIHLCLKNSQVNPIHEIIFINLLQTAGYRNVKASHQAS